MTKFKFGWFGGGNIDDWWFGISPEGFGTFAMFVNFIVSVLICNLTTKTPDKIRNLVDKIRLP